MLRGPLVVDVAIVGGGITGAAAALSFAEAGFRVAVLEETRVGRGSTAASTALIMQEPDSDLRDLATRYGTRPARRIWQLSQMATADFIKTLRRLRISCDLRERDSIYYAAGSKDVGRLRDEFRRRRAARFPGEWLDRAALRRATGIDGAAAIRTAGNAQVDPYKACTGLLRAAAKMGVDIFERSRVVRIDGRGTQARVVTEGGTVEADRVIIATGYATPEFKPLHARFRMLHTYVLATEPIRPPVRRALGLGDVMVRDTGRPYHYLRWTSDGRLLLGGGDHPRLPEGRRREALTRSIQGVRAHFEQIYAALAGVRIEHAWEELFATTTDGLPFVGPHRRYPRHLFALGYGGNGMTFGFLAARLLLDCYRGSRQDDLRFFAFGRGR
jgi:glycine/D-amino acid oxidase-like deaminating enzyme